MRLIIAKDYADVSRKAANIIAAQVHMKPDCVLGLATGSSPVGTYKELIAKYESGELDFSQVKTVNLDEYAGMTKDHDQSYAYFMRTNLFDHVNIDKANTHVPSGLGDVEKNAEAYDAAIEEAGGIDLQLLGIGHNGYIGFNEPNPRAFIYKTNVVTLTPSTIQANARLFEKEEDVPRQAISLGIGGIMNARRIILLATPPGTSYRRLSGSPWAQAGTPPLGR